MLWFCLFIYEIMATNGKAGDECSANCQECSPDDPNFCLSCKKSYGLEIIDGKPTGQCKKCSSIFCNDCSDNYQNCTKCSGNIFYQIQDDGSILSKCNDCNSGCAECYGTKDNCISCHKNYGFDYDSQGNPTNKCKKCALRGCEECYQNYSICDSCEKGFGLHKLKNGTIRCRRCHLYNYCDECGHDYLKCEKCRKGFGVKMVEENVYRCVACDENCDECSINADIQENTDSY